jgi:aryl-alcohol dehydrogenase-like predicted oxidoreductase
MILPSAGEPKMTLPPSSRFRLTEDLEICRILNGMWQVSGAHGRIEPAAAVEEMFAYHDTGFTTWDLADHYGPAEDFIGAFRRRFATRYGAGRLSEIQAFTKWVPHPGPMTRPVVEKAVGISLSRMGVDRLDLLQFHWWDYADRRYLDALRHLADLRDEGKIRHVALTNFDTERLGVIADHGIPVVSNQVQYSLIDRRPDIRMALFCRDHGISLLAYGTLLGGLLSEKFLGRPEPRASELDTASLRKYKNMLDAWGGWALFQELLPALKTIADKHRVGIANIGVRYVLDRPTVAGVIIGARLGVAQHIAENARVFGLALDAEDIAAIDRVLAQSRDLMKLIGDCGDEYR